MNLSPQYQHWSRLVFFILTLLYFFSLVGSGFAVVAYEKYLGNSSPVQSWLNENATSYSTDIYDILIAMQDVSIAFRDALLDKSPENAKLKLKGKVETFESVFSSFEPNTELGRYVHTYNSATEAMQAIKLFLTSLNEWIDSSRPLADSVIFEAENAALIAVWRLATESLQKEFQARDEMVSAINSGRMLAKRALLIGVALFIFGLLALISVNLAIKKWMSAERERFERLEYLLSTVGHDLRSPLQAIMSCAQLLRKSFASGDNKTYVGIIKDSSEQLARLVDDLIGLARNEELKFEHQPLELTQWINKIVTRFTIDAERKGLKFIAKVDTNELPTILFDETRLTQCVGNLLSNAIRYTNSGSITLTLNHIKNSVDDGELLIEVEDTGPGIAEKDRTRIFMPFERASDDAHGKGLGLAIASSIVRAMHGKISLKTSLGSGSTFSISLPVTYSTVLASAAMQSANTNTRTKHVGDVRVLIVDDDQSLRAAFAGLIADMGYASDQAADGEEGFKLATETQYHAIVTDIQMPCWDGFKLAQECRDILNPCPILIAITAYTKTLSSDPRAAIFDKILYKPIDDELLLEALEGETPVVHSATELSS